MNLCKEIGGNMKKNILIFGATGNTGSYLTLWAKDYFKNKDFNVIAAGRRKTDFFNQYGIDYYSVDISKPKDFENLPTKNIYAVIFLAGVLPAYMKGYTPTDYIQINTLGALNILEYCRKNCVDRILYTQTYFDIFLSVKEGVALNPYTPRNFAYTGDHAVYVISKNCAVDLIEHYHHEYGLKNFIFRLPSIYEYSPVDYFYKNGEKKERLLSTLIRKAQNSEPIEIWGNPHYLKDMVYVADFSQILCKACEVNLSGGIYNIGTGKPVTLEEQIKTIVEVFSPPNAHSQITYAPEKAGGYGVCMDIQNAKDELGYEPQYDCRKLFEAYKEEMKLNRFKELLMKD